MMGDICHLGGHYTSLLYNDQQSYWVNDANDIQIKTEVDLQNRGAGIEPFLGEIYIYKKV